MKEFVGFCEQCEKQVFCMDGFLNGELTDQKGVICFACVEENKKTNPGRNDQGE